MTTWNINPIDPEDGPRFYVVAGETEGDEIRFTLGGYDGERKARELRDTLNRLGACVTTHALPA